MTIYDSAFKVCGINFILIHDDKTSELTQNESVKPKSRSKCLIESNSMLQHFEHVLGSNSPALCAEVINLLNDHDFNDINIDILDSEISEYVIIKAIKKLKSGKSAGHDNIIGEMVTACPLFLLRYSRNFLIRYFLMERIQKVGPNV